MLLLAQSTGFVKVSLSESIYIVKTFNYFYGIKLFVAWERLDRFTLSYTYSFGFRFREAQLSDQIDNKNDDNDRNSVSFQTL